jgi:hypothetical protein
LEAAASRSTPASPARTADPIDKKTSVQTASKPASAIPVDPEDLGVQALSRTSSDTSESASIVQS